MKNQNLRKFLISFTALCLLNYFCQADALAQSVDYTLGKNLKCRVTGSTYVLVNKTKELSKDKAKKQQDSIKASLVGLKAALATAKKTKNQTKIAKAQAKLDAAKSLGALVKSCIKGTLTPTPAPTVSFPLVQRGGTYTGTWNNTTFSSSGPMTVTLTITNTVGFDLTVDLDGNVFGGSNPAAEHFTGTFSGSAPYAFSYTSTLFGSNTVITIDAGGDVKIEAPAPANGITNFVMNLDFNDSTNAASGTYTLKAGNQDVTGTVTLTKS